MNKFQQIAKMQQLAESKIAIEAVENKQEYAASRVKEEGIQVTPIQNQDHQNNEEQQ